MSRESEAADWEYSDFTFRPVFKHVRIIDAFFYFLLVYNVAVFHISLLQLAKPINCKKFVNLEQMRRPEVVLSIGAREGMVSCRVPRGGPMRLFNLSVSPVYPRS